MKKRNGSPIACRATSCLSAAFRAALSIRTMAIGGLVAAAACQDAANPIVSNVPKLLSPPDGARLPQNNASATCTADSARGSGIAMVFTWAQARDSGGIAGYLVFAINRGVTIPIIDNVFTTDTQFTSINCHAYVEANYLAGWEWKVRSQLTDGTLSDYSPVWTWTYELCSLRDGTPCHS